MISREISRSAWTVLFDSFSRRHDGWLVNIELDGENQAREVSSLALEGITVDEKGGEHVISISVGQAPEQRLTHVVFCPSHVHLEHTRDGLEKAIVIEAPAGKTRISLCAAGA
jgi:hypothetical protein